MAIRWKRRKQRIQEPERQAKASAVKGGLSEVKQRAGERTEAQEPEQAGDVFLRVKKATSGLPASTYLLACEEGNVEEYQKQILYELFGPLFFGNKQAGSQQELAELFRIRYGIDVQKDFCEGDEHYEEYQEAQAAIAEGLSIYEGAILFGDGVLAELAGEIWADMERQNKRSFRRINTMLEE